MKGRWDIIYVEKPRKGVGFTELDFLYLLAIADNHPEAWKELKAMISKVDDAMREKHEAWLASIPGYHTPGVGGR